MNNTETYQKEIELCKIWINKFTEFSNKWSPENSYYYKHEVENYFGIGTYISNEAFIYAAKQKYVYMLDFESSKNYRFKFKLINRQ